MVVIPRGKNHCQGPRDWGEGLIGADSGGEKNHGGYYLKGAPIRLKRKGAKSCETNKEGEKY